MPAEDPKPVEPGDDYTRLENDNKRMRLMLAMVSKICQVAIDPSLMSEGGRRRLQELWLELKTIK